MIDLKSMSRQDLQALRADIERAIATVGERNKKAARDAAEAAAREHGLSLAELTTEGGRGSRRGRGRGAAAKATAEARFRNPEDHSQTWSGRGRKPRWYSEAEASGRPIEDLRAG